MSKYYEQRKESFFANHVKLITFLIVVGLLLLILGPIFVLNATQWFSGDTRPNMTEFQLIALDDLRLENGIDVETVTQYACIESDEEGFIKVVMEVDPATPTYGASGAEKKPYTVIIIAKENTGKIVSGSFLDNNEHVSKELFKSELKEYFEYRKEMDKYK